MSNVKNMPLFQMSDFAYEFEYGIDAQQPLSLQDEINMSEHFETCLEPSLSVPPGVEAPQPETSNFRQMFSRIFTLLRSTHANENVTWQWPAWYAFMGPTSTSVDWFYSVHNKWHLPQCVPRVPLCTGGLHFCPSSQQMKITPKKTQRFTTAYIICIPNQNIMHGNQ